VLFFSLALSFRPVLEAFDRDYANGGLYSLLNILRSQTGPSSSIQVRHTAIKTTP
jgi:hypothetical protein